MAVGTIFLDIITGTGLGPSTIELCLSKKDIADLFDKEFKSGCCVCRGPMGDSTGDICCNCLRSEMKQHADCCLTEEGEKMWTR